VKAKARRKRAVPSARVRPEQIPLDTITKNTQRLGLSINAHAGARSISKKAIAAESSKIGSQMVRDLKTNLRLLFSDVVTLSPFAWPDTMYVPSDTASSYVRPGPSATNFFTDAWSDGKGTSMANAAAGTMFAWTQALTTDRDVIGEAGLGIGYSPKSSLSYVRFQPEVNCMVTYRGFVDFWPMLIAGTLRVQGSLLMAAWQLSPVTGQPPELVRPFHEVPVFDTGVRDAASDLSPDIHNVNNLSRNFGLSNLDTTFLLQGARTYILGVVPRVRVRHNVTTADGKIIPYDSAKFKLYADLVCQVPDMFASVQTVLIP
jgi:hypothetical protein